MSKRIKILLPLVLLVVLAVSILSARTMTDISTYGKLINYVGIVRGASQRVIKLETNDEPDDELIKYVSGILDELLTGEGNYGLRRTGYESFNIDLVQLDNEWDRMLEEIEAVREGGSKEHLLARSEDFFELANKTVFSIEEYSGQQSASLSRRLIVTAVFCLIVSVIVILNYVKKYFELNKKTKVLADQAGRDPLTGALNLARFLKEGDKILRDNPKLKFAVQYIDFENFKYINDVFGYESGDMLLKKYTELMEASMGENELFGRNVADCFMALRCYEDKKELLARQQKIDRDFMEQKVLPDKHRVTTVCGFCCVEDVIEQLDVQGLMNRANYAKKTVKNVPRKHYAYYDESIRNKMLSEIRISDRMESAMANNEFLVYYQPKVSPADGCVKSAEALVRWRCEDGSFYMPGQFIPVFEKNHSIRILDQYVFEKVCRFLHDRYEKGLKVIPVSVNVSKIRFYTPDFVEIYTEIKNRYKIPDGILEIEFTETVACENRDYMLEIVKGLHENGFLCSLDDFGTGYSSLSMLKDMEIDVLKLDACFFGRSSDVERERIIVQGILQMIRKLEMRTVAEGIETEEQVEFLRKNGCDLIQGYYYFKPIPEEEFASVLDKSASQNC